MTEELHNLYKSLAEHNIKPYESSKPIYKYVDIETAKKIFSAGSIKFSTAEELKDYDLEMDLLTFNLDIDKQKGILENVCKVWLKNKYRLSDQAITNYLDTEEGKKLIASKDCIEMVKKGYKSLHNKVGFFCATTNNNNSGMWSDYAKGGTGVCIEYTLPLFNPHYYTFKVFYDEEFKPFDLYDDNGKEIELSIQRWYFTKRKKYQFEDEIRIFFPYGFGIFTVDKRIFTGLYYGVNTLQTDIDELELLLKNGGYSFSKGQRIN